MSSLDDGRFKSLARTLHLVGDLLQGKSHDRRSAAKRVDLKEAAAYRVLQAIAQYVPGMSWQSLPARSPRTLSFDVAQLGTLPSYSSAIAACFGASLASLFAGTEQEAGMRAALQYVLDRTHRRKIFKHIERKFAYLRRGGEISLPAQSGLLDDLIEAVLHSRCVTVTHRHFSGHATTMRIQPLSIVINDHQLYLIGRQPGHAPRAIRFSRIDTLVEHPEVFAYPTSAGYDPQQLFAHSMGVFVDEEFPVAQVTVRLAASWATYAQTHRWHPTQTVDVRKDGVIVKLRVRLCPELERWILGFGPDAEVIEPSAVRERIATKAFATAKAYQGRRTGVRRTTRR